MTLQLYNTLTRKKEVFEPIDPANVRMYVCGPTVYDYAHIGNARPVVVFDVLFRLLRHIYGAAHVTYARNFTDIDDKIMARAAETGEPIDEITARFARIYQEDTAGVGALPPTLEPRATEHVGPMIAMVETLIDRGHAYEADGHVLFHVPSMPDYGRLSGHTREELVAGARVEVAPYKKDAADFVLWKPSGDDQPGWQSPWGRGRPGWHLECSCMIDKHLGPTIDIHGGGQDLVFPHHENEIAQSSCTHSAPLARFWMHNGYLTVNGEKMSKSLGNFHTLHDLLDEFGPKAGESLRLVLMSAHYRQPLDFSKKSVEEQRERLNRWYRLAGDLETLDEVPTTVIEALNDDLNTPKAIAALEELANPADAARLKAGARFLGLMGRTAEEWFRGEAVCDGLGEAAIDAQIRARAEAREARDFAAADRIRDELAAQGVLLEDGPGGTTWRRAD